MNYLRNTIEANFSAHAQDYDQHAHIQRIAASALSQKLNGLLPLLPAGPALEIGCGTGLLTQMIAGTLSDRPFIVSDLSPDMVSICRTRLSKAASVQKLQFQVHNGEENLKPSTFALILSSFALQWFQDLESSLTILYQSLRPGGILLLSMPTNNSFPEWKENCLAAAVPFTGNRLPSISRLTSIAQSLEAEFDIEETSRTLTYKSALNFFQELKALGASTKTRHVNEGSPRLRHLIRSWNDRAGHPVHITYQIQNVVVRKPIFKSAEAFRKST